jgi:miniconductance mechanosensitive channel
MLKFLINLLDEFNWPPLVKTYVGSILLVFFTALLLLIVYQIIKYVFIKVATRAAQKSTNNWDDALLEHRFFHRLANVIPAILLHRIVPIIIDFNVNMSHFLQLIIELYFTYIFVRVTISLLNSIGSIYESTEHLKFKSIKGYIQIGKILVYIISALIVFSTLTGKNPITIIAGMGAFAAILILVFQDAIKGFVSGIQLSANDMVRIGDWVSIPKYNADGNVIDISLTTIKVQNWDKTISMIPSYGFVSESFSNWRGMEESGGRRIKRSIVIDVKSIHFLSESEIEELSKIHILKSYLDVKIELLKQNMIEGEFDKSHPGNGLRLTNVGTFRAYLELYLRHNEKISQDMTLMVRQMQSSEIGLPLEIYCFSRFIEWQEYEKIQADIFDHAFAIIDVFGLKMFQSPSGEDFRALGHLN